MKGPNKYQSLQEYLRRSDQHEVKLSFAEIEALMGEPLPTSARSKKAWWSDRSNNPKALFLSPDGNIYPDTLICSGILSTELDSKHCPYSQSGRFPESVPLDPLDPTYTQGQRTTRRSLPILR